MQRQNIGEMLLAANLIDQVQMSIALEHQRQSGKRFGSTLVELNFVDENVLAAFLSRQIDVPCISLLHVDVPRKVLRRMTRELALECHAVPVRLDDDGRLEVAMMDPTDADTIRKLEKSAACPVVPLIAPESSIMEMVDRLYPEELIGEGTLSSKPIPRRNAPADPVFWDIIAEMDSGDLEERLMRIEQSLDRVWVLLEKVLRNLEARDRVQ